MMRILPFLATGCLALNGALAADASAPIRALIIDGQNNHGNWPKTTVMMKSYLEESGIFTVDVARTIYTWQGENLIPKYPIEGLPETTALPQPKSDPDFTPDFSAYDVVISNFGYNAAPWPDATNRGLEKYVAGGGGLVVVHAADNSFGDWLEYNKMIGVGGWGGRTEKNGPYVYYNDAGDLVRDDSPGRGGSHGPQHEFLVTLRVKDHPITKGMPTQWLHAKDELYDRLRGPAEKMTTLATAYSSTDKSGTGRHEPMLITVNYGCGRVFHTPMGHADYSQECVGFIVCLLRGSEWAATGEVKHTQIPDDFPTADKVSSRPFEK